MRISLYPISTAMFSSAPWITLLVIGSMRSGFRAGWRPLEMLRAVLMTISSGVGAADDQVAGGIGFERVVWRHDRGRIHLQDDGGAGHALADRQQLAAVEAGRIVGEFASDAEGAGAAAQECGCRRFRRANHRLGGLCGACCSDPPPGHGLEG